MPFEVNLEAGEQLILKYAFPQLEFGFAVTDRAVFLPAKKWFAVSDLFYFHRVPISASAEGDDQARASVQSFLHHVGRFTWRVDGSLYAGEHRSNSILQRLWYLFRWFGCVRIVQQEGRVLRR